MLPRIDAIPPIRKIQQRHWTKVCGGAVAYASACLVNSDAWCSLCFGIAQSIVLPAQKVMGRTQGTHMIKKWLYNGCFCFEYRGRSVPFYSLMVQVALQCCTYGRCVFTCLFSDSIAFRIFFRFCLQCLVGHSYNLIILTFGKWNIGFFR